MSAADVRAGACRRRTPRDLVQGALLVALAGLLIACRPIPGACPDSADRMDASVLGVEGADFGSECDALCPDGTPLGSVKGTVAVLCDGITCDLADIPDLQYPHCALAADLEAWQAEKCPGCVFWDWDSVRPDWEAYPETCAHPYDYVDVRCDWSK